MRSRPQQYEISGPILLFLAINSGESTPILKCTLDSDARLVTIGSLGATGTPNHNLKKRIADFETDMIRAAQAAVDSPEHANKRARVA